MAALCLQTAAPLPTGLGSCGRPPPPRGRSSFCEPRAQGVLPAPLPPPLPPGDLPSSALQFQGWRCSSHLPAACHQRGGHHAPGTEAGAAEGPRAPPPPPPRSGLMLTEGADRQRLLSECEGLQRLGGQETEEVLEPALRAPPSPGCPCVTAGSPGSAHCPRRPLGTSGWGAALSCPVASCQVQTLLLTPGESPHVFLLNYFYSFTHKSHGHSWPLIFPWHVVRMFSVRSE